MLPAAHGEAKHPASRIHPNDGIGLRVVLYEALKQPDIGDYQRFLPLSAKYSY
jgi:hypothetical protein